MIVKRINGQPDLGASARRLLACQDLELASFRLLSRWLPRIQEWELKVELGKQVWDEAQHVDALWRRRSELGEAAEPPRPNACFRELVSIVENDTCTACFFAVLYCAVKPRLLGMYQDHVQRARMVPDPFTARVLQNITRGEMEQIRWGEQVISRLGAGRQCGREESKQKSIADHLAAEYGDEASSGEVSHI